MSQKSDVLLNMSFEDIQTELKGRTQFEEPVVTREVLIDALKTSTYELSVMKAEYASTKKDVTKLKKDNAKLKEDVIELTEKTTRLTDLLNKTTIRVEKAESALKKMGDPEVIGGLPKRVDHVEEFLPYIEKLESLYNRVDVVEAWKSELEPQWADHKERFGSIENKVLNEIEPAVADLVEKTSKAIDAEQLEEKLNAVGDAIQSQGIRTDAVELKLTEHEEALANKAGLVEFTATDDMVRNHEFVVTELDKRMIGQEGKVLDVRDRFDAMENSIKDVLAKFEDAEANGGFGGGITEEDVDAKIDSKYTLIVDQLESAITSATQDEEEFKRVANDLQDMVRKMQMNKADKHEMAAVKERQMIDGRVREQVDTLRVLTDMKMTKEEAQRLIIKKANRSELKNAVGDLAKNLGSAMERRFELQEDMLAGGPASVMTNAPGALPGKKLSETHCLSCRRPLKNGKRHNHHNGSNGSGSPFGQAENDLRKRQAHQGPGGTSLGGGFQVRVPARNPQMNSLPPEYTLPRIDPRLRKAVPFVQGNDGNLYHGRSTPTLHTWDTSPQMPEQEDLPRPISVNSQ